MKNALPTLFAQLEPALISPPAEVRRLFHGRGRYWPGLEQITVDWLQGVLLVALFRRPEDEALTTLKHGLLERAESIPGLRSVVLQHRYETESPMEVLWGEKLEHIEVSEHGLQFLLDLGRKQNTGLFLDMRHGRDWVRQHVQGKRVLNLFAYTCGFSVAAIAGGATQVVNLDMAKAALARGRENHRLNQHDLARVEFLGHELFRSWGKVRKYGPYDLIIIDPPSFQKGSFVLSRDYQKIIRRLPELLADNGSVLACINDPAVAPDFLLELMAATVPQLQFVERLENPAEFIDIDPDHALKALVFRQAVN